LLLSSGDAKSLVLPVEKTADKVSAYNLQINFLLYLIQLLYLKHTLTNPTEAKRPVREQANTTVSDIFQVYPSRKRQPADFSEEY
jgi:hypothetical protein